MSTSTRWLVGVGIAIAAAAVLAAVVAITAGGEETFPDGTPERAVQLYLQAVAERDATTALSYLSSELVERCGPFQREPITRRGDQRFRATLNETVAQGDGVDVHVALTESYGTPPFGDGESTSTYVFELTQENGQWRFAEPPWPLYCVPKDARPVPVR